MRKRIFRMSEDIFDEEKPNIVFSSKSLELTAYSGEENEGQFSLRCENDVRIRGIVYSSNPYVVVKNPQFEGTESTIFFYYNINSIKPGDELSGRFTVIANRFEEDINYHITFKKKDISVRPGTFLKNLRDFTNLYKEHEKAAVSLFYEDRFKTLLEDSDKRTLLLYRGFENGYKIKKNVEAFLVAAGEKKSPSFSMTEERRSYFNVNENQKDRVEITRDTWGEIDIRASVSGDFVTLEKERINEDFFLGNSLFLNYYIHKDRLHHGLNTAVITFSDGKDEKKLEILASPDDEGDLSYIKNLHKKRLLSDLTKVYRDFRLSKIKSREFSDESIRIIDELIKFDDDRFLAHSGGKIEVPPKNVFYLLMKAQALIVGRREEEANDLIGDLKSDITDKRSAEWAYLLYLCTLLEPEEEYINKLTEEIEDIFMEHPEDIRIFWFLLYLREEYIDDSVRKLKAVSIWISQGECSPYIMVEGYYILLREPYLLTEFSPFIKKILRWAVNKDALTKDLVLRMALVLENEKEFDRELYLILKDSYNFLQDEELFMQILSYLLRNQIYGEEYYFWYDEAVKKEVRLTGLYEAYMMSKKKGDETELPELVTLYFRYQNNLSFQNMAYLYSNIIKYRRKNPGIYEKYLRQIETFAMEQMRLNRVDDDLSVIYQLILDIGLINRDVADSMSSLLFTKKIKVPKDDIIKVHVYEAFREDHLTVKVTDSYAYAPILTDEFLIFFEDEEGVITPSDEKTYIKSLFRYNAFYEQLKETANKKLPFIIHDFGTGDNRKRLFLKEDLFLVEEFLSEKNIRKEYKARLYPEIIEFLKEVNREDMIEKHLLYEEPYEYIGTDLLVYIIESAINNALYDKAYFLLKNYNGTGADERKLRKLFSYLTEKEGDNSDDFLITEIADLLEKNCFSENMISYLNKYYVGPTNSMKRLCDLTDDYRLKGEGLYERTLIQMLYTETIDESSGSVYFNYLSHNPNKMVIEAYLTFMSRRYILEDLNAPDVVFSELLRYEKRDTKLNESCKAALSKRLCLENELSQQEREALDKLVFYFMNKNTYFGFFKNLPRDISVKYHLYDKTFIEYRGESGRNLKVRFIPEKKDEENEDVVKTEDILEMYDGIYVKNIVLYFGDTVSYEIFDGDDKEKNILKTGRLSGREILDERERSRFSRLNRMQSLMVYGEDLKLKDELKDYLLNEKASDEMFSAV